MNKVIKIAVDAMGGDGSPKMIIDGIAHHYKNNEKSYYQIFGNESQIKNYINERLPKVCFEIIHTEENRNELLGCLFLHGNNIGEAGLYNLGQVSQSRWCITLHDNEERILQKRHCSCSRPPSRTEEINLPQQNSKLQQQQQQCILENSKSIVFGQLHGEDEWSNQLFAQVFNPVDNVAFEKEL